MLPFTSSGRTPDRVCGCDAGSGACVQAGIAASAAVKRKRAVRLMSVLGKNPGCGCGRPNLRGAGGGHNAGPASWNVWLMETDPSMSHP
jgi:hypothetical protein